ncbi:hypothetical protein LXA43DRAFT_1154674 [Ganoderma leucocontextum]|nr:hypothetical protein LXA43DRAFT_1154674 [Ganoderma leucocontextum]
MAPTASLPAVPLPTIPLPAPSPPAQGKRPRSSSSSAPNILAPSKRRRDNTSSMGDLAGGTPLPEPEAPIRRIRAGTHRETAIKALKAWRLETVRTKYNLTSFSEEGFLSDEMIASLVYDATLKSVDDVVRKLADPPWVFAPRHAQDVIAVLARVDSAHDAAQASKSKSATQGRSVRVTAVAVPAPENDENEDIHFPAPPSPTEIAVAIPRPKPRPRYRPEGAESPQDLLTTEVCLQTVLHYE